MGDAQRVAWLGEGAWAEELAGMSPVFRHGLDLLGDVLDVDGALPAGAKQLFVAGASAAKDRPEECRWWLGRAIAAGVEPEAARGAALTLFLSRGATPARVLLDGVAAVTGERAVAAPDEPVEPVTTTEIVDSFRAIFGEVPDRVQLLADRHQGGLEVYHRLRLAGLSHGRLEPKLAELLTMCVNASQYREDFAGSHALGARRAGATEDELVEAGLTTIVAGGVAAWLCASDAIVSSRAG